jgi:predicted SAM-dependent methyltransferase
MKQFLSQWWQRIKLRRKIKRASPVKIIVGSGTTSFEGWVATDIPYFDVLNPRHWSFFFDKTSIQNILSEHVFEHLTSKQVNRFFELSKPYLRPNGVIRIAVPDGFNPNTDYIDAVKPGGWGAGSDDHKILWDIDQFKKIAEDHNFQLLPVEYYDIEGTFHFAGIEEEKGFIYRSKGKKYQSKIPNYSSLIVDFQNVSS